MPDTIASLAARSIEIMASAPLTAFEEVVHPAAVNHEGVVEPPACRGRGPAAFHATAVWLRSTYSELAWEIHEVVTEGDLAVVHATMSGRHTGVFVTYGPDGRPVQAFPPTGRRFTTTQSHWLRTADGMVIEHWANRDDIGTAAQLGWTPPGPAYLVRMALATRRTKRLAASGDSRP